MPSPLTRAELLSLMDYTRERDAIRARILALKQHRRVAIGEHVTLLFENRATVAYQVQEMLRIEKTTDEDGIQAELDAYNPMIPGGHDWRATLLLEYDDPVVRAVQLRQLRGLEHRVWFQVDDLPRVHAIADEDMERADDAKTSAVHFLRFDVDMTRRKRLRAAAVLRFGVDHPYYSLDSGPLTEAQRQSLCDDLAPDTSARTG